MDDEIELNICYPDYGAVFNASLKSTSLGTFANNALRALMCVYSYNRIRHYTDQDYKEYMENIAFEGDDVEPKWSLQYLLKH